MLSRALSVLLVLFAADLFAAESRVRINPELNAAFAVPDAAWDGRAVLLLHGFADDSDGAGDLMKRLAGELASRGIASLRINFRGEGDRHRTDIRSTADSRRDDAVAAVRFLATQPGVDTRRIGAMGWSLGCVTAVAVAAEQPAAFRALVLWSSPSGDLFAGLSSSLGSAYEQAQRDGSGTIEIPGWKTITLQREFFESYRGVLFEPLLAKFPGAFLTIRGTEDYLPHRDDELVKIAPGRPAEALLIGGADHIFNVFDPSADHAARAVQATVAWFQQTL